MLVQQAGIGSLPLSFLSRSEFLSFMRKIEQAACQERSPIFVYWSSRDAHWLLPENQTRLRRDAFCVAMFSEDRDDKQEEFCFIVESQGLCLVLYGYRSDEHGGDVFQCVGSIDPELVRRSFQMMLPMWQFLDLGETNRVEDARSNVGPPTTSAKLAQDVRAMWSINKSQPGGGYVPSSQVDSGDRLQIPFKGSSNQAPPACPSNVVEKLRNIMPAPDYGEQEAFVESVFAGDALIASTELLSPGTANGGSPVDDVSFVRADFSPSAVTTTTQRPKKEKRDTKGVRALREVWTTISEESREVFPPDAQRLIRDIMGRLRHSSDHSAILQFAIEELTKIAHADRGLVWQVIGDQLTATHEFAVSGDTPFVGNKLPSSDTTEIVSEFLLRFPDETGTGVTGVIAIPDINLDTRLHKVSPQLYSMIELAGVRARVVAQLRCIGRFHGFLELQQSNMREWTEQEAALLQSISETLSIVVQQSFDLDRREMDANEMKLINNISEMFRESRGQRLKDTLSRSVKLVADHMGFLHSQVYLLNEEQKLLMPLIANNGQAHPLDLNNKDNPFVQACDGKGKIRIINAEYSRKGDPFFGHEMALIGPLESEGETLGVLGLWGRNDGSGRQYRPDDRDLAQTICNNLASIVRADQAIAQIRTDRARKEVINRVTKVIKDNASPKKLDVILDELAQALYEHLNLSLCVVSLYDESSKQFGRSRAAGEMHMTDATQATTFAEKLLGAVHDRIDDGPILDRDDLQKLLKAQSLEPPANAHHVTIVPVKTSRRVLVTDSEGAEQSEEQEQSLKAAICLVTSDDRKTLHLDDMVLIKDLADRVAADIWNKELFEQVERQAVTDPMTGLHNRRHFGEQFSKEIDRNQRFGRPFSYIILDLDFLKKINDTYGHQHGDDAIKHIANVIKKCVRDVDTTARFGGEEFVVLLPETDVQGARVVAERMCYAIREEPVNDTIGIVTASIGVATFPYDAQDRDKLTELADQALYLAKHRGRNQVCSVSEDLLPSLNARGEEALEIQKATIKAKAEELASVDLKMVAEYGLLGILGAVMKMIEAKDAYANDRSPRAADYAAKLAGALHLSKEHTTVISLAAILHNIGKIAIPEEILQKQEALTDDERKIIESHPTVGAKILEPAKHLHRVASVVESYHEHWDGSGYPKGLRGEQIPLESRIIALIDAYVAMTSDRPYRPALTPSEAATILQQGAGKQWDPRLVKLFINVLSKEPK